MTERDGSLDLALKELSKYELANKVPLLPLQVINNLSGRKKEEFVYLLDKFCCEFVEKENLELKVLPREECADHFLNGEKNEQFKLCFAYFLHLMGKLFELDIGRICRNTGYVTLYSYARNFDNNVLETFKTSKYQEYYTSALPEFYSLLEELEDVKTKLRAITFIPRMTYMFSNRKSIGLTIFLSLQDRATEEQQSNFSIGTHEVIRLIRKTFGIDFNTKTSGGYTFYFPRECISKLAELYLMSKKANNSLN
jgi:hypothetical protein